IGSKTTLSLIQRVAFACFFKRVHCGTDSGRCGLLNSICNGKCGRTDCGITVGGWIEWNVSADPRSDFLHGEPPKKYQERFVWKSVEGNPRLRTEVVYLDLNVNDKCQQKL